MDKKLVDKANILHVRKTEDIRELITRNWDIQSTLKCITYKEFCNKVEDFLKEHDCDDCVLHMDIQHEEGEYHNDIQTFHCISACIEKEKTEEELSEDIDREIQYLKANVERNIKMLEDVKSLN